MKKFIVSMVVAAGMATSANAASIIGFQVEGGGTPQVFQLGNGNFLGLWGFDNREGLNPGASAVTIGSAADITGGFTSGAGSIVNYYNGANPINAGASEFDALAFGFDVADNDRLFDSVWVEWTGGMLVYGNPSGGTNTMSANATLDGDPLAPIPLPATVWMLVAGLGGLFAVRRRRRTA